MLVSLRGAASRESSRNWQFLCYYLNDVNTPPVLRNRKTIWLFLQLVLEKLSLEWRNASDPQNDLLCGRRKCLEWVGIRPWTGISYAS